MTGIIGHRGLMMAGVGAAGINPPWANVSALLHCDGADGSTAFADETGKTWGVSGSAQIDTAQSRFGTGSALFDGADDMLTHATHADFGMGTGDFTWECFVRRQNGNCAIFDNRSGAPDTASIVCFISATGHISYYDTSTKTGSVIVPLSTWTHVAWCRSSGGMYMFVNGAAAGTASKGNDMGASKPMRIGLDVVSGADLSGHIDEIRITKGVALYTSSFTPPSAPFPSGP